METIKTIRIKTIGTSTEKEILDMLIDFLGEHLQHYELEVSGRTETLSHSADMRIKEEVKEVEEVKDETQQQI